MEEDGKLRSKFSVKPGIAFFFSPKYEANIDDNDTGGGLPPSEDDGEIIGE